MAHSSPFPGMDPYLEFHWRDAHHALTTYARDALNEVLPDQLRCQAQERVFVALDEGVRQLRYPDAYVTEYPLRAHKASQAAASLGATALAEPILVHLEPEPVSEGYLEIIDVGSGNRVITVIEFISPTNKLAGPGRDEYKRKQRECRSAGVNLVEIDLTREGNREELLPINRIPGPKRVCTYHACVWRATQPDVSEVYPIPLASPLPEIPVPLRPADQAVHLKLQSLIEQAYVKGRYSFLDYRRELYPLLIPEDAAWADKLLRTAGKR